MSKKISTSIKVSVIISPIDSKKDFFSYLLCLLNQNTSFYWEIVIIDTENDDTEKIITKLKLLYGDYIVYKKITGLLDKAVIQTVGKKTANGELLIFLDLNMLPDKNFVQNQYDLFIQRKEYIFSQNQEYLSEELYKLRNHTLQS